MALIQLVTAPLTIWVTIKFTIWQAELRRDLNQKGREAFTIKSDIVQNYAIVKVYSVRFFAETVFFGSEMGK